MAVRESTITRTWHNEWVSGSVTFLTVDIAVRVHATLDTSKATDNLLVTVTPTRLDHVKGSGSGAGFINVGGLLWGPDVPPTVNGRWFEYDGDESVSVVRAQCNERGAGCWDKSIIGFYAIDSASNVSGTFGNTAVNADASRTFTVDLSTGTVTSLILGTWARWADTNASSPTYGNTYIGGSDWIEIRFEDLFPDYYPCARKEGGEWISYNADGHSLTRKTGSTWVDLKNKQDDVAGSKVLRKHGATWAQLPKIGVGA